MKMYFYTEKQKHPECCSCIVWATLSVCESKFSFLNFFVCQQSVVAFNLVAKSGCVWQEDKEAIRNLADMFLATRIT